MNKLHACQDFAMIDLLVDFRLVKPVNVGKRELVVKTNRLMGHANNATWCSTDDANIRNKRPENIDQYVT